jgi:hypothetical protein
MAIKKLTESERRKIASVFYDEGVKQIWFHLGDLRVEGKQLAVVARLITEEKIKCYGNVPATILKGREAQYNSNENTLSLSPEVTVNVLSVLMKSIILHEGVHAFFDYKKLSKTTYFHNEAAAYITQALFLRQKRESWPSSVKNDPIIKAVENLINKFNMTSNKAWLKWIHFGPLMKAIQAHPVYLMQGGVKIPWSTKTPADGIAKKEVTKGLLNKRVLAANQRGPVGRDTGDCIASSRNRGPLGNA